MSDAESFLSILQAFLEDRGQDTDLDATVRAKVNADIDIAIAEVQARASADGWEHPNTLKQISRIVDLFTQGHYFQYSNALCARLQLGYHRAFPPNHQIHAQIGVKLGYILNNQARYSQAEESFREAITLYDRLGVSRTDLELAEALSGLSVSLVEQRKLTEAVEVLKHLLIVYKTTFGDSHKDSLATINRLAQVLELNGKANEAIEMCTKSFNLCLETLGTNNAITQTAAAALARLKKSIGHLEEAEDMYRRAVEITADCKGRRHLHTLRLQKALAEVWVAMDRLEDADRLFRQLLLVFEEVCGVGDLETLEVCQRLGELHLSLNSPAVAREFFQRAYDGRCAYFQGKTHPLCWQTLFLIGKTYNQECAWRHLPSFHATLDSARQLFIESHKGILAAVSPIHPIAIEIAQFVGRFLMAYERFQEAEEVYDHLYEVYVTNKTFPDAVETIVDVIMQRGVLKEKFRRFSQACALYDEALKLIAASKRQGKADLELLASLEHDIREHAGFAQRLRDL